MQESLTPSQQRFVTLLGTSWFPPHPEILARVQARVRDERAILDRDALERELQGDPSLYLRTVRELTTRVLREGESAAGGEDVPPVRHRLHPSQLIRNASVRALREVLDVSADNCSAVPFHGGSEWAAKRTAQALFGGVVVDALAASKVAGTGLGFASGVFRQLGMLLIVWHHPHVYSRLVESLPVGQSLDEALARVLGMSPASLGLVLAREWRISPEIRSAMGDPLEGEEETAQAVGGHLRGLCELGESLATSRFLKASSAGLIEYQEASSRAQLILGNDGLRAIFAQVDRACEHLMRSFPSAFPAEGPQRQRPEPKPFSTKLPPFVIEQLQFLRDNFSGGVAPERLRSVVEQVVRSLGFVSGRLYVFDPGDQRLIPRVAWGAAELKSIRSINLGPEEAQSKKTHTTEQDQVVRDAFGSREPKVNGRAIAVLAVPIGIDNTIGVLALEMKREFFEPRTELVQDCAVALGAAISEAIDL